LAGCAPLIDLSQLEVETWPSGENQVLAADDTIRLTFSKAVERSAAESLLSIASVDGIASGDLSWSGRTLVFRPVPELVAAKRYRLEFRGRVTLFDGRQFDVRREVPFFSVSAEPGLRVVGFSPANGASAAVASPLTLTFDAAVDAGSFTEGFTVSPSASYTTSWSADSRTVTVEPLAWTGGNVSWRLSTAVRSSSGVPLTAALSRSFQTNADQTPPMVMGLAPAAPLRIDPMTWVAAGPDLNAIRTGDALLLTVSEPVSPRSLSSALRLTPSVKGHWETQRLVEPCEYVFLPDENWVPGTAYSLQLTGLEDDAGNLQRPYLTAFTPAVPYQQVTAITLTGVSASVYGAESLGRPNVFPVCVPSGVAGALQIAVTLAFSEPFSSSDRTQFATLPFCTVLFPTEGSLPPPALVTVSFADDATVVLIYQGFSAGSSAAPNYYRIRIPGGPGGLKTHSGSLLKEDTWLDFVAGS
jgi:hypothetical protein